MENEVKIITTKCAACGHPSLFKDTKTQTCSKCNAFVELTKTKNGYVALPVEDNIAVVLVRENKYSR